MITRPRRDRGKPLQRKGIEALTAKLALISDVEDDLTLTTNGALPSRLLWVMLFSDSLSSALHWGVLAARTRWRLSLPRCRMSP